ncbi:hypothetical protein BB561_000386 [Smittium simulii]|uniref:CRAL-TRIO domain-containing protein n=1 Tax=Smittium simulii TaxID=133385 RepID=A0A2T9YZG6_9FUNG|nr:hypothetical protein BB561_000386 [Smittium simulii]
MFLKYLEAYYPECLAVTLVHAGPFWFSGAFRMISPWIDPIVAQKIQFTKNLAGLEQFIDTDQIPKQYIAAESSSRIRNKSSTVSAANGFEYKYVLPQKGENDKMSDAEGKKAALEARNLIIKELKQLTIDWIKAGKEARIENATQEQKTAEIELHDRRDECQERLAAAARELDQYTRARTHYHRIGVLQNDGTVNWASLQK